MIVKLPIATELARVMNSLNKLSNTKHFVAKQMPPAKRERKQFALPAYKDARRNTSVRATLKDDLLYINNTLQRQFQAPSIPDRAAIARDPQDIPASATVEDEGNTFTGYSARVSSLDDVRASLDALVQLPEVAQATHVMYAYRVGRSGDSVLENFHSDRDYGAGLEMLSDMQRQNITDTLFVATRTCQTDYRHIGKRRFDHVRKLCREAHRK